MKNPFYDYAQGIPASRILPIRASYSIPTQLVPTLNQFNIKSSTALYNFMQANPQQTAFIAQLSGLYEDEFLRLQENLTQSLENIKMINQRCGSDTDPCATIPANILLKEV